MPADVLDPSSPPPPPAGQPPSPVQPLVPTSPLAQPTFIMQGSLPNDLPGGEFTKAYLKDVRERYGIQSYMPDLKGPLLRRELPPLGPDASRTIIPGPQGEAGPITFDLNRITDPNYLIKMSGIFKGLAAPIFEPIAQALYPLHSWRELNKAAGAVTDPDYDPFADRQIEEAGLDGQMNLFFGSTGREHTRWLIGDIRRKQREAEWMSRAPGYTQLGEVVGGLIGDPANLLPLNLPVKALRFAERFAAGKVTGQEIKLLAARPAIYGAIGDGLRSVAIQAAFQIAEQATLHNLDPTIPGDISADLILPGAIAGSLGMLTGLSTRWTGRRLAQEARDAGFLRPPGARPYGAEGERPGGITEPAYPPSNNGQFPPGSLNTDYGPMRTQEHQASVNNQGFTEPHVAGQPIGRIDHELPADASGSRELVLNGQSRSAAEFPEGHRIVTPSGKVWQVREVEGVKRFVLPGKEAPAAGTWRAVEPDEVFPPGQRFRMNQTTGVSEVFVPGAREAGATVSRTALKPEDDAGRIAAARDKALAEGATAVRNTTEPDYRGIFSLEIDGKWRSPGEFPTGTRFVTEQGVVWEITESKLEGSKGKFFQTVSQPKLAPRSTRLIDQEFEPGELPSADDEAVVQTQAYTAKEQARLDRESRQKASDVFEKDPGMTRLSPKDLSPGMVGDKKAFEESLVITPDGKLWHLNQTSFELAKEQTDMPVGQHNILGIRYGHLTDSLVRITTYGDEIAADAAKAGTTPQQAATLRRIKRTWENEGMGDKAMLEAKPEPAPQPSQPGLVHTADFDAFMKDNRIVDEQGQPVLAFHGTNRVFDEYDMTRTGKRGATRKATPGGMVWFTLDPEQASSYAVTDPGLLGGTKGQAPNVRPAYLRSLAPLNITDQFVEAMENARGFTAEPKTQLQIARNERIKNRVLNEILANAERGGHDAAIFDSTDYYKDREATGKPARTIIIFDPKNIRHLDQRYDTVEGSHQPGSVGAQLSPGAALYQQDVLLAQGRLAPTGIGLEKLPLNPVVRAFQGASVAAMRFAADLVSTGGLQTVGNREGIANLVPVETLIQMNWNKRLVDALRHRQDQWSAYRQTLAGTANIPADAVDVAGRSDWQRVSEQLSTAAKDKVSPGQRGLSFEQFRIRVAEALNNGDADEISDAATPYINKSAAYDRTNIYEHSKQRMLETGVFDEQYAKAVDRAQSDVVAIKKEADEVKRRSVFEKWDPARTRQAEEALLVRMEDAEFKFQQQKKALDDLKANGPQLNGTAQSYRPRLPDAGKLIDNEQAFFDKVVPWFQSAAGGYLDLTEAVRLTKQIHELWSHSNPIYERADSQALFHSVAGPGSALARSFTIPDKLIKDFLVNDADVLARYHIKQTGAAVEMKERFGSLDAAEQMAEIERDYRNAIERANAGSDVPTPEAIALTKQLKTALYDAQALRDKIYGTFGASPDPHRWDSRTIRIAKQFNNLTLLGMSGISAMGDLIRPLMTEGIDAFYGHGLRSLMSESRATILKMNKAELELEGNGMELMLNVRALAAADTGDFFGGRGKFEHGMNQANSWMFVANGLNGINQIDKEWARLSISGRVNNILLDSAPGGGVGTPSPKFAHFTDQQMQGLIDMANQQIPRMELGAADTRFAPDARAHYAEQARLLREGIVNYETELSARGSGPGVGIPLSELDRGRFAAAGIGEDEARRIGLQLKIHGVDFGNIVMSNTGAWTDDYARDVYRSAMNQFVNRTVPTPGIGDRPNWASTEWGSLIAQYKSFGMGSLIRGAYSGLQEGGNRFWYGAASTVGFAILLNEVRSQLFYDKSTFDKPAPAVLIDGIDRSGILGWFGDANRAVETLTGHRVGLKPMTGAQTPITPSLVQVAGTLGGPTAGQAARVVSIANDYLSGHPTSQTTRNWRALTPGGTLPYADPVMDALYGTGNYPRGREPRPQQAR